MSRRISAAKRQPVLRAVVRTAAELALLAALGLWAAAALEAGLQRPTRTVLVDGRFERVQVPEVEELLRPQLGVPLADVDLDQVRHEVERLPWVATVQAERRWPDTLRITVRVGRWSPASSAAAAHSPRAASSASSAAVRTTARRTG
jgi:cell division septal protein FtsQ